jgi:hypothetical protein
LKDGELIERMGTKRPRDNWLNQCPWTRSRFWIPVFVVGSFMGENLKIEF